MNLLIIRLIIFVVLFWAGLKLYRMYREWQLERDTDQSRRLDDGQMVRCSYCRVHLPENDAVRQGDQWFCSPEHRDKFLERKPPPQE
ncbi:PP0621 family protein [Halomonas sp. M20]|uniref:PP0621 family protein n=1 Tax=Halomonas sp. M20 TaxID=2763264 RepID=UPI001D0B9B0D|nr:PP0621 family protein [Halomonas sp. M20]